MTENGLTRRQKAIVAFIQKSTAEQGWPPSVREIGAAVGLPSPSSVAYQLGRLETLGVIELGHKARAIRVVDCENR